MQSALAFSHREYFGPVIPLRLVHWSSLTSLLDWIELKTSKDPFIRCGSGRIGVAIVGNLAVWAGRVLEESDPVGRELACANWLPSII